MPNGDPKYCPKFNLHVSYLKGFFLLWAETVMKNHGSRLGYCVSTRDRDDSNQVLGEQS